MASDITTRFFIISDTHGDALDNKVTDRADVAIHCGDLTEESKLDEFRESLNLLKEINAPLKLVIAGNHDFTMDVSAFRNKIDDLKKSIDDSDDNDALIRKEYGDFGEARTLFESEEAKAAGIVFLDEGIHRLELDNGAMLTVYASPYTHGISGWGFQYAPDQGHEWAIDSSVDIAITHSPPKGVLDYTDNRTRAGSPSLFGAIARAKPRVHCFGHIHEAWGAKKVTWCSEISENPTHFTDIDNDESHVIESLSGIRPHKFDTPEILEDKEVKRAAYSKKGYCSANETLRPGEQTLFVNAAIEGPEEGQQQLPWMVDINLPRRILTDTVLEPQASTSKKRKAEFGEVDELYKKHCSSKTCDQQGSRQGIGSINSCATETAEVPTPANHVLCR